MVSKHPEIRAAIYFFVATVLIIILWANYVPWWIFLILEGATIFTVRRIAGGKPFSLKKKQLEGNVIIVTGANTGIGFTTSLGFAKAGATVYLACRDEGKGKAAVEEIKKKGENNNVHFLPLDLSDQESVQQFVANWGDKKLDILVNNAGIWTYQYKLTKINVENTFHTNHLGPFQLTLSLLPVIKKYSTRVINLTGDIYVDITKRPDWRIVAQGNEKLFDGKEAYCHSKLANIIFTQELQKRYLDNDPNTSAVACVLHPGIINSELLRETPKPVLIALTPFLRLILKSPEEGARTTLFCSVSNISGGKYYLDCEPASVNDFAKDETLAKELWQLSEKFTAKYLQK